MSDKTTFEFEPLERDLIIRLLLDFARSVDTKDKYSPNCISHPLMLTLAEDALSELGAEYAPTPAA